MPPMSPQIANAVHSDLGGLHVFPQSPTVCLSSLRVLYVTCILVEITLLSFSHDKAGNYVPFTADHQRPRHLADQHVFYW